MSSLPDWILLKSSQQKAVAIRSVFELLLAEATAPEKQGSPLIERLTDVHHPEWHQRRIDFQPYPYPSYTEERVRSLQSTRLEGDSSFLQALDPAFVARDLVDERFVRKAIDAVDGPSVFGIDPSYTRQETLVI